MKAEKWFLCQNALAGLVLCASVLILSGCSASNSSTTDSTIENTMWMANGSVALSRPSPSIAPIPNDIMLGLFPGSIPALASTAEHTGSWVSITRKDQTIAVMNGDQIVYKFRGEGLDRVTPGTYHLLHKQRNPLWYAPDSYFSNRSLVVPPAGDRARFRRGALGDFVIFLNKDTPIHSGPIWTTDIGGARLEENDLSRVYYKIDIGVPVEVQ